MAAIPLFHLDQGKCQHFPSLTPASGVASIYYNPNPSQPTYTPGRNGKDPTYTPGRTLPTYREGTGRTLPSLHAMCNAVAPLSDLKSTSMLSCSNNSSSTTLKWFLSHAINSGDPPPFSIALLTSTSKSERSNSSRLQCSGGIYSVNR
jgi:hypothetical protein